MDRPLARLKTTVELSLLVAAAWACGAAQAQSLSALAALAKDYDAQVQAAQRQVDVATAQAQQSRAALLPTVGLGGSYTIADADANAHTKSRNITLSASQPLYNRGNRLKHEQAQLAIESAQIQLRQAQQDLMARLAQAYFDLLGAKAQLVTIGASKRAAAEQLERAKRNFEVGTATITDTHEAQAQFDRIVAAQIAAQNDASVAQLALDHTVGQNAVLPRDLRADATLPDPAASDVQTWVQQGLDNNPQLQAARVGLRSADFEIDKAKAGHLPTVNLNYNYNDPKVIGSNCRTLASGGSSICNNQSLTLSVSLPLFAGYAVQNGIKASIASKASSEAKLSEAQRTVAQGIRQAFFNLRSGASQIKALQAAVASSQSALKANQTGYEVGVRINADVLAAQSQLYQTQVDLSKARYRLLTGDIKLRQAAGTLSLQDLQAVDGLLAQ